jgi:hypothetical protein
VLRVVQQTSKTLSLTLFVFVQVVSLHKRAPSAGVAAGGGGCGGGCCGCCDFTPQTPTFETRQVLVVVGVAVGVSWSWSESARLCVYACVCVCVSARARARGCVCVCVCRWEEEGGGLRRAVVLTHPRVRWQCITLDGRYRQVLEGHAAQLKPLDRAFSAFVEGTTSLAPFSDVFSGFARCVKVKTPHCP